MKRPLLCLTFILASEVACHSVFAQTYTATTHDDSSEQTTRAKPWEAWRLTEAEWRQYKQLMQGPRGIWTPNLDPISVLGSHAANDAERAHFARIAAEMQLERLQGEHAWQRSFLDQWKRYTDDRIARELPELSTKTSLRDLTLLDALVLIVDTQCIVACKRIMTHLVTGNHRVDVFFVGEPDRDAITQWAKTMGIPPEAVNAQKRITLNLDTQKFAERIGNEPLPLLFVRSPDLPSALLEVSL